MIWRKRLCLFPAAVAAILLAAGFFSGCDQPVETAVFKAASEPDPSENAYYRSGPIGDGAYVLPNGRRITPAGRSQWVFRFPNDVKVTPDGLNAVVTTIYEPGVLLIDTAGMEVAQAIEPSDTFVGIVFNSAGDRFWIGGGSSHTVQEYSYVGGTAIFLRDIRLWGFPSGMALSPDEQTMYVCANTQRRVAEIDLASGLELRTAFTQSYPYDAKLLPNGSKLYVSNWGSSSVSVIDTGSMTVLAHIPTGKNPTKLAISPDGSRIYTADADTDTITVIDTLADTAVATWPLHSDAVESEVKIGSYPNAIDISADGARLYVASAGYNCITVVDTGSGEILGRIPTGWFTTGVDLDDDSGVLWAVNGKGYGSSAAIPNDWAGTVQAIDLPNEQELASYTNLVEENAAWGHTFFNTDREDFSSPIPTEYGKPSEQIKHVIFVLKENKTYDQIFGDLEGTERDPAHLVFGENVTPNQHRLAREFTVFDNLYVEGDISVLGHFWATAIQCNEFAEKMYPINMSGGGRYPLSTLEPAEMPADEKFLWDNLIEHGIDFRLYGQIVGITHDLPTLLPYVDLKYGFWNMGTLDVDKVGEFIREVEAGYFPPLVYMLLPNDHNYGSSTGLPTPDFLVGDNDAGLGRLVDYLSHSRYWEETVVFVIQDDPQSGSDHIDKHRTIALAIGPWVRRGHVSSVMYSSTSIWRTIDLILGIPPTTKFDQYTAPMYDAFTTTPDFTPYESVPNPIPFELNEKGLPFQDYCDKQNFLVPDQVRGMGKVYWALKRPGEPFPYELSVDIEDEDEDEDEEAREYLEALDEIKAYALQHGLELPDETPFWEDPEVLERLRKHNEQLHAGEAGGY